MGRANAKIKSALIDFFKSNQSDKLYEEICRFCGVSIITAKRWSKNNGMAPKGFILLKLEHFLDVHGFKPITDPRSLDREVETLGKTIAFGVVSVEEAMSAVGITLQNNFSRLIMGRVGVSDELRAKIKEFIAIHKQRLDGAIETEKSRSIKISKNETSNSDVISDDEIAQVVHAASLIRGIVTKHLLKESDESRKKIREAMMSGAVSDLHETWEVINALLSEEATEKFKKRRNRK